MQAYRRWESANYVLGQNHEPPENAEGRCTPGCWWRHDYLPPSNVAYLAARAREAEI